MDSVTNTNTLCLRKTRTKNVVFLFGFYSILTLIHLCPLTLLPLSAFDLMKNRNTHSCNTSDLSQITSMIKRVAKTDRFPVNNSVEGMQVIQSTWDKIDVFNHEARYNKFAAKLAYVLLLVLGAAVSIITVISLNGECRKNVLLDYYIF